MDNYKAENQEQEIDLVIQLEDWNKDTDYDRLGLEEK